MLVYWTDTRRSTDKTGDIATPRPKLTPPPHLDSQADRRKTIEFMPANHFRRASFGGLPTDEADGAEVDERVKRRRRSFVESVESVKSVGSVGSVDTAAADAEAPAAVDVAGANTATSVSEHIDCATVSVKPKLEHDRLPILSPLVVKLDTLDDDARSPDTVVPTDQVVAFDHLEPSPAASMATPSPTSATASSGVVEAGMYTPCTAKVMLQMTSAGTDTDTDSVRSSMFSPSSTASGTPNTSLMGTRTPGSEESDTAEMLYSDSDDSHAEDSPCHPVHAFSGSPLMSPGW